MIGSTWNKWDLHAHSPSTHLNGQFGDTTVDEYVETLDANDIAVIGVTNYFFFQENELEDIRGAIRRKGLNIAVLGNLEFRIAQPNNQSEFINIHCIFAEHLTTDIINKTVARLKLKNTSQRGASIFCSAESTSTHSTRLEEAIIDYEKLKEVLSEELTHGKDFLFAVCPNGYGGFRPTVSEGRSVAVAIELDKFGDLVFGNNDDTRDFFLTERRANLPPKPVFSCSDAHNRQHLGQIFTWVKAIPSFEGLRQCLLEPEDRVQITDDFTEKTFVKPHFSRIELAGNIFPGQPLNFRHQNLILNPNMIAIIGGRGTGKSVLLDSVRSRFTNLTKPERVNNISVDKFTIELNQGDNSLVTFDSSDSAYSYLHVSQGDIKSVSQDPNKLSNEIKRMLGLRIDELSGSFCAQVQRSLNKFSEYQDYVSELSPDGNLVNKASFQKEIILSNHELIKTLTSPSNKELIASYQSNVKMVNEISRYVDSCTSLIESIDTAIEPINESIEEINTDPHSKSSIPKVEFLDTTGVLRECIRASRETIEKYQQANIGIVEKFKQQGIKQDVSSLLSKISEYQRLIDRAEQKLAEIEERDKEYWKHISERVELANTFIEHLEQQEAHINQAFSDLLDPKQDWNAEQNDLVKEILTDIEIYGSIDFSATRFYEGLLQCINRGRFRETSQSTSRQKLEKLFNVVDFKTFCRLIKDEEIITTDDSDQPMKLSVFCWRSEYFNQNGCRALLDYLYKQSNTATYLTTNAAFKYKSKTIEKLSVGQRGTFYVCLKLATDPFGSPFIFDQPEDDLDNDFIMKQLVPLFRKIKKYRQVIIVTHNANLVVNSDAEQIIVAKNGYTDLMVDGAPLPHQPDTIIRWLIDRPRS